jgi:hypothetical protein
MRDPSRNPRCDGKLGALGRCRLARGRQLALIRHATATIFRQEGEQRLHGVEARGVDLGPPLALNSDKSSGPQPIKVNVSVFGATLSASATWHSVWASLDKQPQHIRAVRLGEGREGLPRGRFLHNSATIELFSGVRMPQTPR